MTACRDKLRFETKKLAKQRSKRVMSKTNDKLKCYRCKECDGYHMTSKTKMAYTIKARGN